MRWRAHKSPVFFLSFVKLEAKGGGAALAAARGGPRHERTWACGLDYGHTLFMHRSSTELSSSPPFIFSMQNLSSVLQWKGLGKSISNVRSCWPCRPWPLLVTLGRRSMPNGHAGVQLIII